MQTDASNCIRWYLRNCVNLNTISFLFWQLADSFNFNPHKWMMVNFDCSALWMKDCYAVADAFNVDPLYLQHKHDQSVIDFRVCGVIYCTIIVNSSRIHENIIYLWCFGKPLRVNKKMCSQYIDR